MILDYTAFGDHFWTGKGYGINLADSDGFQVVWEGSPLRSPHNSHLTFLARSGVPGLALWALLQATVFFSLLRAYFRCRPQVGKAFRSPFVMAYLLRNDFLLEHR